MIWSLNKIKFPKNRWKEIGRAEKNDAEGNRIYKNLKAEYLEKYMPKPDADPHSLSTGPENFKNVEILWASVREPYYYLLAKQLGCHIITIPPNIIEKIENFGKTFEQLTKETVKAFLLDSKKSKFKI